MHQEPINSYFHFCICVPFAFAFLLIAARLLTLSLCKVKAPKIVYNENIAEASINMDSWALIPEKW